eukprot:g41747.t1
MVNYPSLPIRPFSDLQEARRRTVSSLRGSLGFTDSKKKVRRPTDPTTSRTSVPLTIPEEEASGAPASGYRPKAASLSRCSCMVLPGKCKMNAVGSWGPAQDRCSKEAFSSGTSHVDSRTKCVCSR